MKNAAERTAADPIALQGAYGRQPLIFGIAQLAEGSGGDDVRDIFGLTCQGNSVKYPGVISNC
jgi:hypothetical protein